MDNVSMIQSPVIKDPSIIYHNPNVQMQGDKGLAVLVYGHPGTWKTTWAASWPGVVFCSIRSEGGDDSLKMYPDIAQQLIASSKLKECPPVFNTTCPPKWDITSATQLTETVLKICKHHKEWKICTVVVDSLTYLIDLWIDDYIQLKSKDANYMKRVEQKGGEFIGQMEWGFLYHYLRRLRVNLSNEGLNIIWTCLQNDKYKADERDTNSQTLVSSLPMISGRTKELLPGMCQLIINAERRKIAHQTAIGRQMIQPIFWTSPNHLVDLRHKYFNKFPQGKLVDPEFGDLPTFRAVWSELHPYIYTG